MPVGQEGARFVQRREAGAARQDVLVEARLFVLQLRHPAPPCRHLYRIVLWQPYILAGSCNAHAASSWNIADAPAVSLWQPSPMFLQRVFCMRAERTRVERSRLTWTFSVHPRRPRRPLQLQASRLWSPTALTLAASCFRHRSARQPPNFDCHVHGVRSAAASCCRGGCSKSLRSFEAALQHAPRPVANKADQNCCRRYIMHVNLTNGCKCERTPKKDFQGAAGDVVDAKSAPCCRTPPDRRICQPRERCSQWKEWLRRVRSLQMMYRYFKWYLECAAPSKWAILRLVALPTA